MIDAYKKLKLSVIRDSFYSEFLIMKMFCIILKITLVQIDSQVD